MMRYEKWNPTSRPGLHDQVRIILHLLHCVNSRFKYITWQVNKTYRKWILHKPLIVADTGLSEKCTGSKVSPFTIDWEKKRNTYYIWHVNVGILDYSPHSVDLFTFSSYCRLSAHLFDGSSCTWWPWGRAGAPSPPWSGSPWWGRRCCQTGQRTLDLRHSDTPNILFRILW